MPSIYSIAEVVPPNVVNQDEAANFVRNLFTDSFKDIERLLSAFPNGQIEKRYFAKELDWYKMGHSFEEKNNAYIETAVELGRRVIEQCLNNPAFLKKPIPYQNIDAIFFISTTGLATPSIEARIMNELPFSNSTKRIPIWGLGCAGGACGLSRANEYCLAFPTAMVLVLSVELCSLTFQHNDLSKSNLIGTSLFADGAACALVCGDQAKKDSYQKKNTHPFIIKTQSRLMPDSLDVMGWKIQDQGLFVVFSRDIPNIIAKWLKTNVMELLRENGLQLEQMDHFIAHPGGKKVLEAYEHALGIPPSRFLQAVRVLKQFGNMSSATIFFVLKRHMELDIQAGTYGLAAALGPGFSSELLLLRWL